VFKTRVRGEGRTGGMGGGKEKGLVQSNRGMMLVIVFRGRRFVMKRSTAVKGRGRRGLGEGEILSGGGVPSLNGPMGRRPKEVKNHPPKGSRPERKPEKKVKFNKNQAYGRRKFPPTHLDGGPPNRGQRGNTNQHYRKGWEGVRGGGTLTRV